MVISAKIIPDKDDYAVNIRFLPEITPIGYKRPPFVPKSIANDPIGYNSIEAFTVVGFRLADEI